jgi:hypothetical protein
MSLRIGFDMDGVLANFAAAYRAVEERLYGPAVQPTRAGDPEEQEETQKAEDGSQKTEVGSEKTEGERQAVKAVRRRHDVVWQSIRSTPDFWITLKPTDEGAVRRIQALSLRLRWEVFFITRRPDTEGDTVQRQTQRWLVEQGFELPSVLVIAGSRGAAAAALRLDYHVDDSANNCIDVKSESGARPLLISDPDDETTTSARRLGIGTAASITAALDILEQASLAHSQPPLLHRLAKLVGWQ